MKLTKFIADKIKLKKQAMNTQLRKGGVFEVEDAQKRDELIKFISEHGDRYGSILVEFMEKYHLHALKHANRKQLQEFIYQRFHDYQKNNAEPIR